MKAEEMVMIARLADHYEKRGVEEPLEAAKHDLRKIQRDAPALWRHVYDSEMSHREVGDWLAAFAIEWSRSGMSVKNFAADKMDEIRARRGRRRY